MAFDEIKDNIEDVQENTKAYLESSVAYYKLLGFKMAMKSTTMLFKFMLIAVCLVIILLFVSLAGALAIGKAIDSYPLGFLTVGAIYIVLTLVLFLVKDKLIDGPILKKYSEIFFSE